MKPKAKRKLVPVPAEPKFSSGFYISLAAHILAAAAGLWGTFLLATGRIEVEEGEESALTLLLVLMIPTAIVYLCSAVTLLRQLRLGHPWVYDGSGYRDTYASGYFLWMHLYLPVRYIPEEAILFIRVDEVGRGKRLIWEKVVHIDPKRVDGISFAKDLARAGWGFCRKHTAITSEEFRSLLARYPDAGRDEEFWHPERLK